MDPHPEFQTQELSAPPPELGPELVKKSTSEDPSWSGIDLLIAGCAFLATVTVVSSTLLSLQAHATGVSYLESAKNPGAMVVVPAMIAAYVALLATLYLRIRDSRGPHLWALVAWHWPRGARWLFFVMGGAAMALLLPFVSRLLPFPRSIPLDRFFREPNAAYMMMFMGVLIAPFTEEVSFRGFLYPVLDRWLQTALGIPQRLFHGSRWLFLMAVWGYLVHRVAAMRSIGVGPASALSLLLALFAFVPISFFAFNRWLKARPASPVILPGFALCGWGFFLRAGSERLCSIATAGALTLASLLLLAGATGALSSSRASRLGRIIAVVLTSSVFAMVHSEQLAGAWGPLLLIFVVGLVLTITRVVTRSVAPGFLIHVAYNFTLFASVYLGTDHFRHLERLTH